MVTALTTIIEYLKEWQTGRTSFCEVKPCAVFGFGYFQQTDIAGNIQQTYILPFCRVVIYQNVI